MTTPGQLPLPLDSVPRYGREDFLVGKANETAFAYLERWPNWLSPTAILSGPEGSGKTHLATIFATDTGAQLLRGDHLTLDRVPELAAGKSVVLEDCDRFPPDEAALFHLINLAREKGFFVLITARVAPDLWRIATPDLISRLRASPRLDLRQPDDALLRAIFVKHFADLQISVDANVISYVLPRIDRTYAAALATISALNHVSLTKKRPITRALAGEVILHSIVNHE